jgi:hypothetical protein
MLNNRGISRQIHLQGALLRRSLIGLELEADLVGAWR